MERHNYGYQPIFTYSNSDPTFSGGYHPSATSEYSYGGSNAQSIYGARHPYTSHATSYAYGYQDPIVRPYQRSRNPSLYPQRRQPHYDDSSNRYRYQLTRSPPTDPYSQPIHRQQQKHEYHGRPLPYSYGRKSDSDEGYYSGSSLDSPRSYFPSGSYSASASRHSAYPSGDQSIHPKSAYSRANYARPLNDDPPYQPSHYPPSSSSYSPQSDTPSPHFTQANTGAGGGYLPRPNTYRSPYPQPSAQRTSYPSYPDHHLLPSADPISETIAGWKKMGPEYFPGFEQFMDGTPPEAPPHVVKPEVWY